MCTCKATERLLHEPSLWQAAVFEHCGTRVESTWHSVVSLHSWIKQHGPTLQQLQLSRLPLSAVCVSW